MKEPLYPHQNTGTFIAVICYLLLTGCHFGHRSNLERDVPDDEYPGEWMYRQRAFPYPTINTKVYDAAIVQAQMARSSGQRRLTASWQSVGPTNVGGRITAIALNPVNKDLLYIGVSNGGVFRSTDGGATWEHIFAKDGRLAVGALALSAGDPKVLYLGTGEANGSATSGAFFGDGLYRSDDRGNSWQSIGLKESQHIGRIVVDPRDADRVFVAATGYLYGKNDARGIYRSEDGGQHWDQVLFVNDSTSAIDIAMDERFPDTLYAAFWERIRHADARDYAGLSSGVYRTFDGGSHWERLTNGLPMDEDVGRIGLAVGPDGAVYAAYSSNPVTNDFAGLYKSLDAGQTWVRIDDGTLQYNTVYAGFGWYFGNVRVNPHNANDVYICGLNTWRSQDGGVSWSQYSPNTMHVDHHGFEIHPADAAMQVLGTDGGLYISKDAGFTWDHVETLPITEFYTCDVDAQHPQRYYGGAQDNGTLRTLTGHQDDWENIFGGDGFFVLVDPQDTNVIYCEYQWGNMYKSTDGGYHWDYSLNGVNGFDRTNWDTPYLISPQNHNRLYYGTNRLYTSKDAGNNWKLISGDLTNTDPNSPGGADFGALSTIAVAPSDSNVIYTGSEDGVVFVTFDMGDHWQRISDNLPIRYVTHVAVDPYDAYTAYVTISGYRALDYLPHVFRTVDGGASWEDISGNLPEVPLNDLIVDPDYPDNLYVASDLGVWYTTDLGLNWYLLGNDLPMTSIADLVFHAGTRQLTAASFGLSMYSYDLSEPLTEVKRAEEDLTALRISPNPVHAQAQIAFTLLHPETVRIDLYDMQGGRIRSIDNGQFQAGRNTVQWSAGRELPGVYVVRVTFGDSMASRIVEVQ